VAENVIRAKRIKSDCLLQSLIKARGIWGANSPPPLRQDFFNFLGFEKKFKKLSGLSFFILKI